MAMVGDDQGRRADGLGQCASLGRRAAQDQRLRRPQHRVQVQQHVDRVDKRADLPRAVEFDGMPRAVQERDVPDPVHVLVEEARRGRPLRIEPVERGQVEEAERQFPAGRRQAGPQQPVQHDGAGEFVAVHQRQQRHMRAGPPGSRAW